MGVKCDYPPFGYINGAGTNAGYGIDIVHKMAQYAFGNPNAVKFTCVTGSDRVGYLTTGRIDLIVATMSYTPARAKVIKFSAPYFDSGVKLLVPKSSSISSFANVKGKSVISITGTTASLWLTKCMPKVHQALYKETSQALSALQEHRGVAFAQDDTLLVDLAAKNSTLKVVGKAEAASPWGMGTKSSAVAFSKWVNAALHKMQTADYFWQSFKKAVPEKALQSQFASFVPRPGHSLTYPTGSIYVC
ncbi:MAG: transporter substrate-binding domain-containing protein [Acidimicrobiales bacterium]